MIIFTKMPLLFSDHIIHFFAFVRCRRNKFNIHEFYRIFSKSDESINSNLSKNNTSNSESIIYSNSLFSATNCIRLQTNCWWTTKYDIFFMCLIILILIFAIISVTHKYPFLTSNDLQTN